MLTASFSGIIEQANPYGTTCVDATILVKSCKKHVIQNLYCKELHPQCIKNKSSGDVFLCDGGGVIILVG